MCIVCTGPCVHSLHRAVFVYCYKRPCLYSVKQGRVCIVCTGPCFIALHRVVCA